MKQIVANHHKTHIVVQDMVNVVKIKIPAISYSTIRTLMIAAHMVTLL